MKNWHLTSRRIDEVVKAEDQHGAFNTLRTRPVTDFGLVVTATAEGEPDEYAIPIRTSALMFLWGRDFEAKAFVQLAIDAGLGDTTISDMRAAGRA